MCHQVLHEQGFQKDPRLTDLASRDDTGAGASHERLGVDAEQRSGCGHIEGSGIHGPALVTVKRSIEE